MSRRASFFAKLHPGKRRVRFPDEIVFDESIKESDGEAIISMLRRASIDIDVNRINMAGMTALHQAVLDENIVVIRLLLIHGADINKRDVDSWTPLHAACANGHTNIVKYLLTQGANRDLVTEEGESAADLVDPEDFKTMSVLENTLEEEARLRRQSLQEPGSGPREHAAWFRRESLQEERKRSAIQDYGRKPSAWVQDILEEEDEKEVDKEEEQDVEEGGEADGFHPEEDNVEQFQVWRTRRKGRLELTHPDLDLIHKENTLS